MKRPTLVLAFSCALGGLAAAQTPPTGDQPGTGTTDVTPDQPPQPPQPPPQPPQPPPHPVENPAMHDDAPIRPSELAFAIGIGYRRPPGGSIDLQTPNLASVRLRLPSGLTFEPTVSIANSSTDSEMAMMQSTDTTTEFGLGTLMRLPIIQHGHVDFEVLGSFAFDVLKVNPDGDYNTKTTTSFELGWGIGIGYWLSHHWQLSMSATNPLASYVQQKTQVSQMQENKASTTSFGVTFDPTVFVMIHLYN